MRSHSNKIASKRYVSVNIWSSLMRFQYTCHWTPNSSTADIKRDLNLILNADKSWLVKPHHMLLVCGTGAVFNVEESRDLEAVQELAMRSYHGGHKLLLKIIVGSYPTLLYVVTALPVAVISMLAFYVDKKWAQDVFFRLLGHVIGRFLYDVLLDVIRG